MSLTDGALNLMGTYLAGLITHAQLHTGDPGVSGTSNVSSAARQPISFNVDADGDLTLSSAVFFTGGAASGACTHISLWNASSGGTFRGSYALTGDQTFSASGAYGLTSLTIAGTSS